MEALSLLIQDQKNLKKGNMKKGVVILIIAIVLLNLNNVAQCFVNDNAMRWKLYDWDKVLTPFVIAMWLFFSLSPYRVLEKSLALYVLIDYAKEVFDMAWSGNANDETGLFIQASFQFLAIIFCIYKANQWDFDRIKSDCQKEDGVYVMILPPRNISSFFMSQIGAGIGRLVFMVRLDNRTTTYRMRKSDNGGVFSSDVYQGYIVVPFSKIIKLPITEVHKFSETVNGSLGSKYHCVNNNCITACSIALKEAGIKINFKKFEFIPQIFIKKLLYGTVGNSKR